MNGANGVIYIYVVEEFASSDRRIKVRQGFGIEDKFEEKQKTAEDDH